MKPLKAKCGLCEGVYNYPSTHFSLSKEEHDKLMRVFDHYKVVECQSEYCRVKSFEAGESGNCPACGRIGDSLYEH